MLPADTMRKKLVQDISASTVQVIVNQVLGLLVFLITSRYLDKAVYGELNWSLAVLTFITTLLSLRLEQVIVRKVAAGDDPGKILTLFFGHILFSGILFYLLLLAGSLLFPGFFTHHSLLLVLAVSHLLSFFSLPFKQLAAGKERFGLLALVSSIANLVRAGWLLWVVAFSSLDIGQVLWIYIISSVVELVMSFYLVQKKTGVRLRAHWGLKEYCVLINESLPQVGVVFLNACVARIDWILLGIFSTQVITAEYSFAYKVFELSPVPMLILAPVLLTRFSGYFQSRTEIALVEHRQMIGLLIRLEMVIATFLPLLLNIVWVPLVDSLTNNKYGAANRTTFLLLSLCIPLQYLINLFWTIHFSQNHLALILRITAITCSVIVIGDLVMIPLMNARGAAVVYLLAMLVEYLVYLRHVPFLPARDTWLPLLVCVVIAMLSGAAVYSLQAPLMVRAGAAAAMYTLLILATGQLRKSDLLLLKPYFPWNSKMAS
ncbi:MAG: hypothetical protein JWQ78_61 [Sediminibacterium sp.]|nr:hypothetical protein [Sediminibacterium sp.]